MAKKKGKGKGSSSNNNSNSNKNSNNKNTNTNKSNKQKNRKQNKWQQKDDDDDMFRESLVNQGNTINDMDSDGNCLFRSISDQLYHDNGAKHDIVRHDICEFLSSNKEEFAGFLLMNDDDEDVLDIDEYIEKMREDGEWGGNVEVVVASRVYKRNIVVFSFEYSNGALSIVCEDKDKKDGSDLLLSYHGESHYNSVHPIGGPKKIQLLKPLSNDNADATPNLQKKKKENKQEDTKADSKSRNRPPTRGSSCPCGSGLKYKKCCMASEKSKKRIAKHMKNNEKKEDSFIGDFKVLTI